MSGNIKSLNPEQDALVEALEEFVELARKGEVVAFVGIYVERHGKDEFAHRPLYLGDVLPGWETTMHRLDDMKARLKADCDADDEWADFNGEADDAPAEG